MKKHIYLWIILYVFPISTIQAECVANAGNDTTFCIISGSETLLLGGDSVASGGVPPYTYTWSCTYTYSVDDLEFTYTASDFLNDTTAANPEVISTIESKDNLTFYLTVTDSTNNICIDSVTISFCEYVMISHMPVYINQGDSAHIYASAYGSCPPFTYQWEPDYNISDPNLESPLVWPDSSIVYSVVITDASGCMFYDICEVFVSTVNIENTINESIKIYLFPNPTYADLNVKYNMPFNVTTVNLSFYDSSGRKIDTYYLPPEKQYYKLNISGFSPGTYFYVFMADNIIYKQGKLLITK